MALRTTWTKSQPNYEGHLTAVDSYCRITSASANKTTACAEVIISTQPSTGAKQLDRFTINFEHDLDGANIIKQAYQFLKTLPEFSDATDC